MKKTLVVLQFILIALLGTVFSQSNTNWQKEFGSEKGFIPNKGQFDSRASSFEDKIEEDVLYVYDGGTHNYFFTSKGVYYELVSRTFRDRTDDEKLSRKRIKSSGFKSLLDWQVFQDGDRMNRIVEKREELATVWNNANPNVEVLPMEPTGYTHTYSFYTDSKQLSNEENIPSYSKLVYKNVYSNIDVVYEIHPVEGIKYSLVVHPGADLNQIKLDYSRDFELKNGQVIIPTIFGDIVEHTPVTFYQDNEANTVGSSYKKVENSITFKVGQYDNSKTLVIDPWVQTPSFNTNWNCVWECEYDANGNVYIIGGVMPLQLLKYDPTGNLQWTYNTPYDTTMWLGGFATDDAGNSYVCNGSSARIQKINTNGNIEWNNPNPGGLLGGTEFWNITFNCDQTRLIIGGTELPFGLSINPEPWMFEMDLNTGNVTNSLQLTPPPSGFGAGHEVRSITASKNNKYYYMTHDTLGYIHSDLNACGGLGESNFKYGSEFDMSYKNENYRVDNTGVQALKTYEEFVFVHRGDTLQKRNYYTGEIISQVQLPNSGVFTNVQNIPIIGPVISRRVECSGIDIDECGNIFVGTKAGVVQYNQNLSQLNTFPTSFVVYDVHVNTNGNVIAAGSTGNSNSNSRNGFIQSFNAGACNVLANICCDASLCPVDNLCISANPVTLQPIGDTGGTWSASCAGCLSNDGVFDPSAAGVGVHEITYTLPCGEDKVFITVDPCSELEICEEENGNLTVSGGNAPYQWQVEQTTTSPINNQQSCESCGYFWIGFGPLGQCLDDPLGGNTVNSCTSTDWTTFDTGETVSMPSEFPIRIIDANGDIIIVNSANDISLCGETPPCPEITVAISNQSDVSCAGESDGSATVNATGGAAPYTYTWTPGNLTGATQNGLPSGEYTVTAEDADGCSGTISLTINEPTPIVVNLTPSEASCGSTDGSIASSVSGGTPPYSYEWSTGAATQNLNNVAAGNYQLTVTDSEGCSVSVNATIATADGPEVTVVSVQDVSCFGETDGAALISASGGASPYTYDWQPGGLSGAQQDALGAGTYTVTVTDQNDCVATVEVVVNSPDEIELTLSSTSSECDENTGSISVIATGGAGGYDYLWSNNQTTSEVTNVGPGTYSVVVTDQNGCEAQGSVSVNTTNGPTVTVSEVIDETCAGSSDGFAEVEVSGGTPGYTYNWTPFGGSASSATNLTAGQYTVEVTDAAGCLTVQNITIGSGPGISASIVPNPVNLTQGEEVMLTVETTPEIENGTYVWTPETGLSCTDCPNPIASPNSSTQYTVYVIDENGCQDSSTVNISVSGPCADVFVPNIFSPNGDGNNDELCVLGSCITLVNFRIFNRWGELVFRTEDQAECWDGVFRDKPMNTGEFVYKLEYIDENGVTQIQSGNLTLVR